MFGFKAKRASALPGSNCWKATFLFFWKAVGIQESHHLLFDISHESCACADLHFDVCFVIQF